MSLFRYCILISALLFASDGLVAQKAFTSNAQILAYCQKNSDTYIAVVWPRGCDQLAYITQKLNQNGHVICSRKLTFSKKQLFSLFCKLHTNISHKKALKYFKPYLDGCTTDNVSVVMLVFQTKASLIKRFFLKNKIRKRVGQDRYSIHMNDYHARETAEALDALFNPADA